MIRPLVLATCVLLASWPMAATARLEGLDAGAWPAVGRLARGGGGFCTASLIAPDLVLTAAHCLVNKQTGETLGISALTFELPDAADLPITRMISDSVQLSRPVTGAEHVSRDLALLRLADPIAPGLVAPMEVETAIRPSEALIMVSQAHMREQGAAREDNCAAIGRDEAVVVLACHADFGTSGAPIIALRGERPVIVGLVSATARRDGKPVTLVAEIGGGLDALVTELARREAVKKTP